MEFAGYSYSIHKFMVHYTQKFVEVYIFVFTEGVTMIKKRKQSELERGSGEEEKYQFMREQIRPQRRLLFVGFVRKLLAMMVLAVVFGFIAGATFIFMQNIIGKGSQTQASETMLQSTTDAEVTREPDGEGDSSFLGNYRAFWREVADVGKRCNQSIVNVQGKQDESGFQKSGELEKAQSGVIFQENKKYLFVLVPAYHLSEKKSVEIEFFNGDVAEAEVLGVDDTLEIVVLMAEKKNISEGTKKELRIAEFYHGGKLEIGSPVIAVGSPNGVMRSVISGNIVNNDLTSSIIDGEVALYSSDIECCEDGNGFVSDLQGRIVGMITNSFQKVTGKTGCAFVEMAKIETIINHLAEGREMVYFGIKGCNCGGQDREKGVYVTDVLLHSPAYRGKIRVADVITKLDEHRITSLQEMRQYLLNYEEGDKMEVTVLRHSDTEQNEKRFGVVFTTRTP